MICPRCQKNKNQQNYNRKISKWVCPECNDEIDGVKSSKLEKNRRNK